MHTAASFVHHHPGIALVLLLALLYVVFHGSHYRGHRRSGLNVWISLKGPFHTRISKRL